MVRKRLEPEPRIELAGRVVLGINHEREPGDLASKAPRRRIHQEELAQSPPGVAGVNGQTPEQDCRNLWISRKLADGLRWQIGKIKGRHRERVESGHLARFRLDRDKRRRDPSSGVLAGLTPKIEIQGLDAAAKVGPIMRRPKRLDYERRPFCGHARETFFLYQAAAARRLAFGGSGSSNARTKTSRSLGPSFIVSPSPTTRSAASVTLFRMKSVIVRPCNAAALRTNDFCARVPRVSIRSDLACVVPMSSTPRLWRILVRPGGVDQRPFVKGRMNRAQAGSSGPPLAAPPELSEEFTFSSHEGAELLRWLHCVWEDHLNQPIRSMEFLEKMVLGGKAK